jgi:hypothetical protein
MSEPTVVATIRLGTNHTSTGRTTHRSGVDTLPSPAELRIVKYAGDVGYLLLHLDDELNEITDTHHDSLESAFEQANWEFSIARSDWIR